MPNPGELFQRDCELIIGPKITGQNAPQEPTSAKSFKSHIIRSSNDPTKFDGGFKISFNIEKDQEAKANKAKINIYNLSQETRNFLEDENLIVFLKAGYLGRISTIFFGNLNERVTTRQGADLVTSLECGDQEKILQTANVQIGLGPGGTNIQAFNAAAEAMSLVIPPRQLSLIPNKQFVNGFSFDGTAKSLFEKLTRDIDFKFSIQDGEIQVLGDQADNLDTAVLITPETGLINFPTKTKRGAKFISLLNPDIVIGRKVKLVSKQFEGALAASSKLKASEVLKESGIVMITKKIVITGDSHEGPWAYNVEGIIPGTESSN